MATPVKPGAMSVRRLSVRIGIALGLLAAIFLISRCRPGKEAGRVDLTTRIPLEQAVRHRERLAALRFGFDPRLDPIEEARIYNPLLRYLEQATGKPFTIRFTKRGENIIDNLGTGVVQFAALGSVSSVRAHLKFGATSIVRGRNSRGEAAYRSALVTRPGSAINTVADLRGRSFAFGDENSTQGYLIPRIMLLNSGITLDDLKKYAFTGSHLNCAEAVISGLFDAGGMQDTLAYELQEAGRLKIIATSRYYPSSGISVAANVDQALVTAVQKALVAFDPGGKDGSGLYHWEKTEMPRGFLAARQLDYDPIRQAMVKLGILPPETVKR